MPDWVQIISSVGFPIAMCIGLCWYIYNVQTELQKLVADNTMAMKELIDKLDILIKEKEE